MKSSTIIFLISGLAVYAAAIQRDNLVSCCFSLVAQGIVSGHVGEDAFGENGVGTDFPKTVYCISNGTVTENGGQPCAILSSNGQFVCEPNSTPTSSRFTLADNGNLLYQGSPNYFACPSPGLANDGSYNIFSYSIANATSCTSITLLTGGFSCAALGRPSTTATATKTTSAQRQLTTESVPAVTQSPASSQSCPTDISGGIYLAPNLIIPVSPASPATAYGTQYTATITPSNSTLFAFDIPYTYTGTCALIFLFPYSDAAQFPYTFSGIEEESALDGGLNFTLLNGEIDDTTSWNSRPPTGVEYGVTEVFPGQNYTVAMERCASGQRVGYQVSSVGGVFLDFFQSVGGSPIGLWVVPCL